MTTCPVFKVGARLPGKLGILLLLTLKTGFPFGFIPDLFYHLFLK